MPTTSFGLTLFGDQNLLLLGAIPSRFRWIFFLPPLLVGLNRLVLIGLGLIATIALWRGPQRSLMGRLYYTLLTLAGISGAMDLYSLGVIAMGFS